MTNRNDYRWLCPHCNVLLTERDVDRTHAGKAIGGVAGLAAAAAARNIWVALGTAVIGAVIGAIIDENVTPHCKSCGTVLKALLRRGLDWS